MPILVKHDVGGGNISSLLQLALAAGQAGAKAPVAPTVTVTSRSGPAGGGGGGFRQGGTSVERAAQLKAAREGQMREIDAQANRDKEAADQALKVIALKTGLGQEMQEQEYDMEVKKMQEKARIDANQFEWKMSAQDRQEVAKINNASSQVRKLVASGEWSQEEGEQAEQMLQRKRMGIEPSAYPADLNKPPPPQESIFVGPDGNTYAPARTVSKVGDWRYTREAMEQQRQQDASQKRIDSEIDLRAKLAVVTISAETPGEGGKVLKSTRPYKPEEIDKMVEGVFGAPQQQQREPIEGFQGGPTGPESDWADALESQGVEVSEERRKMPLEKGSALSLYDAYIQKFGSFEEVPDELKPAFAEIIKTVRKHRGK